ncbi:MAG: hypothetical protein ACREQQ_18420 [Candidatus Binatia bacterium]
MKHRLCLVLVLAAGCSRAVTPPLDVKATADRKPIRTLAVMPVAASPTITGDAASRAPGAVTQMLLDAASRQAGWKLVSSDAVATALRTLASDTPEAKAGALAARVGADATLTATVATYEERFGSDYGASEPASVSIQLLAVPAGRKQATWKANYTFRQEPLAYNLFNLWGFIRGGPKWLTADELAKIGVDEAVKRLAEGPHTNRAAGG